MAAQQAPAFEMGKLYDLPIIDIKPDPDQPRKYVEPVIDGPPERDHFPVAAKAIGLMAGHSEGLKNGEHFRQFINSVKQLNYAGAPTMILGWWEAIQKVQNHGRLGR
jgi:hypothetical protein